MRCCYFYYLLSAFCTGNCRFFCTQKIFVLRFCKYKVFLTISTCLYSSLVFGWYRCDIQRQCNTFLVMTCLIQFRIKNIFFFCALNGETEWFQLIDRWTIKRMDGCFCYFKFYYDVCFVHRATTVTVLSEILLFYCIPLRNKTDNSLKVYLKLIFFTRSTLCGSRGCVIYVVGLNEASDQYLNP